MSLLWKKLMQLTMFMRPSPKHNIHSRFAQSINFTQYIQFPLFTKKQFFIEGISLFASWVKTVKVPGSMTVEAAVVLPLFLFFFLNLGSAMEMICLHSNLQLALWQVGNRLSVYGCVVEELDGENSVGSKEAISAQEQKGQQESVWADLAGVALSYVYVRDGVEDYLGEKYLDTSPLKEGANSLQFPESNINEAEDCFEIVMTYQVTPLGSLSVFWPFRMANKYYGHFWNGYAVGSQGNAEEYVYITENGQVYHVDRECTHLLLSIKQVNLWEAQEAKNEEGEKYRSCEFCCEGMALGKVYITEQGDCYHYRKRCVGLKRTVYKVTVAQAEGYRACSRCAGGH